MARSMLLISRQAPWAGPAAREALDLALAGGAFDLPLSLLFLDDGVLQLTSGQQPQQLQQKDLGANLQALPLFGIEQLYASQRSLTERGLQHAELGLPVQRLDDEEVRQLLAYHDLLVTL
ncbi:sulfurtransferase complex subunit TusC [Pseudomonas fluvialis]|uniref:Sulfurtransferase complex subunit TusC n=1 Tax=Pseudomonas fluvialis TaxID=1793966 RepID=A0A2I0CQR8_9PSED|nr:sulfurtransferase complex subunit TusC [Pseudomonas pharmacofabricae]PKF71500.1 sulfurtransferase complex subunit TusC [Pseudomonas pharmacofabricae]